MWEGGIIGSELSYENISANKQFRNWNVLINFVRSQLQKNIACC